MPRPRFRIVTLLGLVAAIAIGLGGWRDYWSPKRVWRRASHDPDLYKRLWAWNNVSDGFIDGLSAEETVAEVILALDDPDPDVRGRAVDIFRLLEHDPRDAIRRLAPLLRDENVLVRQYAAGAIGDRTLSRCQAVDLVLAELRKAIDDPAPNVRCRAIHALGMVVYNCHLPHDPDDGLIAAKLQDPSEDVRAKAKEALTWLRR